MDELYASLGRKTVELENLNKQYDTLLLLLGKVVSGEIDKANVTVNLEGRSWALTQPQVLQPDPQQPDPQE